MKYYVTINENGNFFFRTDTINGEEKAVKVYASLVVRFPQSDGWNVILVRTEEREEYVAINGTINTVKM